MGFGVFQSVGPQQLMAKAIDRMMYRMPEQGGGNIVWIMVLAVACILHKYFSKFGHISKLFVIYP